MIAPRDTPTALDTVAPELSGLLVRLGEAITPAETLALRDRISALLAGVGLHWRDLAERMTAPRSAAVEPPVVAVPPMPPTPLRPMSEIEVDPGRMFSDAELRARGGYRTALVRDGIGDVVDPLSGPADPAQMNVAAELAAYGHRVSSPLHFGRYGVGPVPETFETIPGESVEEAGDRLAYWAIAKSGQPFWQDPQTGRGYMPGVTVPGCGKVRPDGTLGPLPAEE